MGLLTYLKKARTEFEKGFRDIPFNKQVEVPAQLKPSFTDLLSALEVTGDLTEEQHEIVTNGRRSFSTIYSSAMGTFQRLKESQNLDEHIYDALASRLKIDPEQWKAEREYDEEKREFMKTSKTEFKVDGHALEQCYRVLDAAVEALERGYLGYSENAKPREIKLDSNGKPIL